MFGLAHGCLGTVVASPAAMLVKMPPTLTFQEASTVPTVFTTVHMGLHGAALLKPSERVLVHASAGGVGLAAVQLAQAMKATVISTAGGSAKRSLLHSLGVRNVIGSRDTVFVSEMAELGGADVVLNSLTSSGMVAGSLASLHCGGRFVEISKRDIWSGARVAQERPDVTYSLLAVDFLPASVIHTALTKVAGQLAAGVLSPLRIVSHSMGNATSALRQMTQAAHAGKVVAAVKYGGTAGAGPALPPLSFPSIAITGGSGGLGLMISSWLCQRTGPLHINLLSRGGKVAASPALMALMATTGCVTSSMADAGLSADADEALRPASGPPLMGLMHASGVLQDAMLDKQTATSFKQVYAPKIGALGALGFAAQMLPLSTLTMFSSVASLLGGAGQGNYASANAIMDAWAYRQQSAGGAATAVQWGAWASSGMASEAVLRRLIRIGQGMISAEQGLLSLHAILKSTAATARPALTAQVAVNDFLWKTYLKENSHPFFAEFEVAEKDAELSMSGATKQSAAALSSKATTTTKSTTAASTDPATVRQQVHSEVKAAIVQVLGSSIGDDEPLMSAGLDSLGSVEFSNVLSQKLSVAMPGTLVFDYPSVTAVTEFLTAQLMKNAAAAVAVVVSSSSVDEVDVAAVELAVGPWSGLPLSTVSPLQRAPVAVVSMAVRQILAGSGQVLPAGGLQDKIQKVPLGRWDLDGIENRLKDPSTLSAQVRVYTNFHFAG